MSPGALWGALLFWELGVRPQNNNAAERRCSIPHIQGVPDPRAPQAAPEQPQRHLTEQFGSSSQGFHAVLLQHSKGGPAHEHVCAEGPGTQKVSQTKSASPPAPLQHGFGEGVEEGRMWAALPSHPIK